MIKTKFLIGLIITLIIISCDGIGDPGGEPIYNGFEFSVLNRTNNTYEGKILIGGLENNIFKATDSVNFSRPLEIGGLDLSSHFVGDNRWQPNLETVRKISNKCYFKIKLNNNRNEVLLDFDTNGFFSLDLPQSDFFKGGNGKIFITIKEDNIWGDVAERE